MSLLFLAPPLALTLRLAEPAWLLLLLLPAALFWWARRRPAPALPFAPALLLVPPLPASPRQRLLPAPPLLRGLALGLGVLALTDPRARLSMPREVEGIDLLLCLDRSSSMAARDLDPERSRLAVVRAAATRFAAGRPQDRIGLLAFARWPDVLCPPTLDHESLARILAGVETVAPDDPEDATGIGTALARAAEILGRSPAASRVAVLLTDGEENVATPLTPDEIHPLEAAALCRERRVRVHVLAAGPEAAAGGPLLREVARTTGGSFHEALDAAGVEAIWDAVDRLETVRFRQPRQRTVPLLPWLAAGACLLLGLGHILDATWLRVRP